MDPARRVIGAFSRYRIAKFMIHDDEYESVRARSPHGVVGNFLLTIKCTDSFLSGDNLVKEKRKDTHKVVCVMFLSLQNNYNYRMILLLKNKTGISSSHVAQR